MPTEIAQLTQLQSIRFQNPNWFPRPIPNFSALTQLQSFTCQSCNLNDTISNQLPSTLTKLDLYQNTYLKFSGGFANLPNLFPNLNYV